MFTVFAYYCYAAISPLNSLMINGLLILLGVNTINMFFQVLRMMVATIRILRAARRKNKMSLITKRHVFVIPNYKEPLHVLRNTLQYLAR